MEPLDILLKDLGELLKTDLKVDNHHTCLVLIDKKLPIHLELHTNGEHLLIGCCLMELPPGKIRENILREAMKSNGLPQPQNGTLGYSTKTRHLILFSKLKMETQTGEGLYQYLLPFIQKAYLWKEALERNQTPPLGQEGPSQSSDGKGMFGLK